MNLNIGTNIKQSEAKGLLFVIYFVGKNRLYRGDYMNMKFLIQCGICIICLLIVTILSYLGNEKINQKMDDVFQLMSKEITINDIKTASKDLTISVSNILDKKPKETDKVYAKKGGDVLETGYTKKNGLFVTIKHPDDTISRYTNLSEVYVLPEERVSQGKEIGTSKGKEDGFSYELLDKKL